MSLSITIYNAIAELELKLRKIYIPGENIKAVKSLVNFFSQLIVNRSNRSGKRERGLGEGERGGREKGGIGEEGD